MSKRKLTPAPVGNEPAVAPDNNPHYTESAVAAAEAQADTLIEEFAPDGAPITDEQAQARAQLAERNAEAQAPTGNGARKRKGPRNVSYLLSARNRHTGAMEQLCSLPTKGQLLRWLATARSIVQANYDSVSILRVKDVTAEVLGAPDA